MIWIVLLIAALVLLIVFPRQTLVACGIAAAVLAVALAWYQVSQTIDERRRSLVTATIAYLASDCPHPGMFPLRVQLANGSGRKVTETWFTIEGYVPGYSKPVRRSNLSTDKIILAGQAFWSCWALPTPDFGASPLDPAKLDWKVSVGNVQFAD